MLRPRRSPTRLSALPATTSGSCADVASRPPPRGGAVVPLVAAVALAAAGGLAGSSWWIGQRIDREVDALSAALDEHPQVAVRHLDYQHGLFSGTLRYDVDVFVVDVASTTPLDTPLTRVVSLRGEAPVRHGPWLGAPRHPAPEGPTHGPDSGHTGDRAAAVPPVGASRLIDADGHLSTAAGSLDGDAAPRATRPASLDAIFARAAPRLGLARIDLELELPVETLAAPEGDAQRQRLFVAGRPALTLDWRIDWAGRSQIIGQTTALVGRFDDTTEQANVPATDGPTPVAVAPTDPARVAPLAVAFDATASPAEPFALRVDPVRIAVSARNAQRFDVAIWAPRATLTSTTSTAGDGVPASVGVEGLAYVQHVVAATPRAQRADDASRARSAHRPGLRHGALFGRGHLHVQRLWFDDGADVGHVELHDVALVSALEDDDRDGARDADARDTLRALIALDLPAVVWNDHAPGHLQFALEIDRLDRDAVLELIALAQAFASLEHAGPPLATLPTPPDSASEEALEASRLQAARALETLAEAAIERLLDAGLGVRIAPLRAGLGPTHDLTAQLRLDLAAGAFTQAHASARPAPDDSAPGDTPRAPSNDALGEVLLAALSGDAEARLRNAALEPLLRRVLEAQGQDPGAAAFAVALVLAVVEETLLSSGFVERDGDHLVARARLVDGRLVGVGGELDLRDLGVGGRTPHKPSSPSDTVDTERDTLDDHTTDRRSDRDRLEGEPIDTPPARKAPAGRPDGATPSGGGSSDAKKAIADTPQGDDKTAIKSAR